MDQSKIKPFNSALNLKEKSLFHSTDTGKQGKSELLVFGLATSTLKSLEKKGKNLICEQAT